MQGRSLSKLEIAGKTVRTILSFALSPLDALWGLRVGYKARKNINEAHPEMDNLVPNASWGRRIGTLLFVTGFIIALAVPIPGLAPVYAALAGVTAKIMGVSIAGLVGRTAGAIIGSYVDLPKLKAIEAATNQSHLESKFNWTYPLKAGWRMGLFGESAVEANTLIKLFGRFLGKCKEKLCCCFSSKKSTSPINNDGQDRESVHSIRHNSIASRSSSSGSTFHTVKAIAKTNRTNPVNVVRRLDSFGYVGETGPRLDMCVTPPGSMTPSYTGSYVPPTPAQVVDGSTDYTSKSTLTFSPTRS